MQSHYSHLSCKPAGLVLSAPADWMVISGPHSKSSQAQSTPRSDSQIDRSRRHILKPNLTASVTSTDPHALLVRVIRKYDAKETLPNWFMIARSFSELVLRPVLEASPRRDIISAAISQASSNAMKLGYIKSYFQMLYHCLHKGTNGTGPIKILTINASEKRKRPKRALKRRARGPVVIDDEDMNKLVAVLVAAFDSLRCFRLEKQTGAIPVEWPCPRAARDSCCGCGDMAPSVSEMANP
ncbi:uncharacterized protein BJ171DRAFT_614967 [Polychytrium aggregatum]|uniref:uncharacterized protein n=1 Tax=Polychytrium aggregatum TaxID=110093 RepID=UPI0022FE2751|nr:uncharacterized protein BJ171DRAFT_614967 [Polychytrium aggregatum]KAI9205537.1 hypothetical protein BJ171DRAFT_614967 [Polychytrium aggregatum]